MNTLTEQQSLRFEVSDNAIVTLWLDGGGRPVVVLDRNLIQRLNTTLDEIEALKDIKGLMLKSDCERVFVAGADLADARDTKAITVAVCERGQTTLGAVLVGVAVAVVVDAVAADLVGPRGALAAVARFAVRVREARRALAAAVAVRAIGADLVVPAGARRAARTEVARGAGVTVLAGKTLVA